MSSCDRMTDEQVERLALAICATAEVLGYDISPEAADMMAEDLAEYPAALVGDALRQCRRELTGKLTLAGILQRIQRADGHPEPDEAWAIALSAADEAMTVVMTEEVGLALTAAQPVLRAGDKIGGRRTFLAAYERLVGLSRQNGRRPNWSVSLGHDQQHRLQAIEDAGRLGRLPATEVEKLAAPIRLALAAPSGDGKAIAGLITGNVVDMKCPENRERWAKLREQTSRSRSDAARRRAEAQQAAKDAEHQDLEARKQAAELALQAKEAGRD